LPRTAAVTDVPIALAASAWVTTEQESKLAVVEVVVVVADALVVDGALEAPADCGADELHAARRMATGTPITIPTTPGCNFRCILIRLLEQIQTMWAGAYSMRTVPTPVLPHRNVTSSRNGGTYQARSVFTCMASA
jgi:hypothetical protein